MKSIVREFPKGAVIFREGDPGNMAFILTEGSVDISIGSADKRAVVSVLKPVSVFGEMALLTKDQRRTATATARSDSKVAEITKRDFDDFVEKSPKLINAVLTVLVDRLQKTTSKLAKSPNLFLGLAQVISLLVQHTGPMLKFDPSLALIKHEALVSAVSHTLLADIKDVRKNLEMMETLGLVEHQLVDETKFIKVIGKEDFLERCGKIHATLQKMANGVEG